MSSSNCSRCSMVILDGECSVCRGAVDWPAFWRSLPPAELLAAAKAMPKIAGTWEQRDGRWYRPVPHEDDALLGPASWQNGDGQLWCPSLHKAGPFPDRASADAALRAADWILVDEETKP